MFDTPTPWTPALPLEKIPVGGTRVFKSGRHQLALVRLEGEQVYAIDNRCPHEGYPLAQGYVKDCVLTCAWHNYKFDVRDGRCIMGEEDVPSYPTRVVDGVVEVQIPPVDLAAHTPKYWEGLQTALVDYRPGQAAREVVRLLAAGVDPAEIAFKAAQFDAIYAEYGPTHALPLAWEVLRYLPDHPGPAAVLPLMQALELASDTNRRLPARELPDPVDPGEDPVEAGQRLRHLVEGEDAAGAQALIRGAVRRGWTRRELEPWLLALCADHFLDFGHALIYTHATFDLLDHVGPHRGEELLTALVYGIVVGTREDTLPYMAGHQKRVAHLAPELPALYEGAGRRPMDPSERARLRQLLLDGAPAEGFDAFVAALRAGAPLEALVDELVLCASERLMRFDWRISLDPTVQNDWLDVTHRLTFCHALRLAVQRWRDPDVLRLLLQGVRFVQDGLALDLPPEMRWADPGRDPGGDVDQRLSRLRQAMARRDEVAALDEVAGWLHAGLPLAPLSALLTGLGLGDVAVRGIVVAHVIKTTSAALAEVAALGDHPLRHLPLLATVRFVSAPLKERRVGQAAHEAVRFVIDGQTPHKLAE